MDSKEFVEQLERSNAQVLSHLRECPVERAGESGDVLSLLRIALKNELEATELAARWMPSTAELDVFMALARQVGDEAKHYRLLEQRFLQLGGVAFDPRQDGYSPLFQYLLELATSVERLAAGHFTREAIAQERNDMFLEYLESVGDQTTARLYIEVIQPDEEHHHQLGRDMLIKYATSPRAQASAREACRRTLEIAELLRGKAIEKTGILQIPGC